MYVEITVEEENIIDLDDLIETSNLKIDELKSALSVIVQIALDIEKDPDTDPFLLHDVVLSMQKYL